MLCRGSSAHYFHHRRWQLAVSHPCDPLGASIGRDPHRDIHSALYWYALRRFAAATVLVSGVGVVIVLAIAVTVPPLTGFRGGSYVAALVAMVAIGVFLHFLGAMSPAARFFWPLRYFSSL